MKKRITLQMVADYAGVSRGTVDRVINNRAHVSQNVYQRVVEALEATGYMSPKQLHTKSINGQLEDSITIGVLLPNWTGYFETEIQRGLEKAKEDFAINNVKIITEKCESDLPQEAIQRLQNMRNSGVQGFAICAPDMPMLSNEIRNMSEEGVPVITFNSDLPDSGRLLFVGQDYRRSGRVAGELLRICTPKDACVLATVGNHAFYSHRSRLDGFRELMKEVGRDDTVHVVETFNDYHLTYQKVGEFLKMHPDTAAIYMANQSIAGCMQAVQEANLKVRPHIITHDYSMETKILLEEGSIDFTISQNIYQQGFLPISLLWDYLSGREFPEKNIISPELSIICSQNL